MANQSPYEVKRKIGEGGMGAVYLAHDRKLNREVAIKVLQIDPNLNLSVEKIKEVQLRFKKEAQAAARLNHPNIVSIYQVGETKKQHYIVMELLKGESLAKLHQGKGKLPLDFTLRMMIQVCDALDFAHQSGIVHRDVKPDNIIILEGGRIKITDFGIARIEDSDLMKTRLGTFLGSPAYSAPEQLRDFSNVDGRADLFSVGVILYQMLVGVLPFGGNSSTEVISRIISSSPTPPRTLNPSIPPKLEKIILKAIQKDPKKRFQSAKELSYILKEVLKEIDPTSRLEEISTMKTEILDRRLEVKPRSLLPPILGVIFIISALVISSIYTQGEQKILDKNVRIKGTNIAKMLGILGADLFKGNNIKVLNKYLKAMSEEKDIVFLEIIRKQKTITGIKDEARILKEADLYVKPFPLVFDGKKNGIVMIGFSKADYMKKVYTIKIYRTIVIVALLLFIAGYITSLFLFKRKYSGHSKSPH